MTMLLPQAPPRKPSLGQRLSAGVGQGLQIGEQLMQQHQQRKQQQLQQESVRNLLGEEYANAPLEFQKMAHESKLKEKEKQSELYSDLNSYDTIEDRFGKNAADLWLASTEGGRTKVIDKLLKDEERYGKTQNKLKNPEISEDLKIDENVEDFDYGLTPAERTRRQEKRYEKALPLIQQSQQKLHAYDTIGEELETLKQLSPQIGGWDRLNINPMTGDLIIPGLASPEAQQFVKTINDFTIQAKDSYGARVTNFDLNQFMRRLPTLANSEEGRERILEQMRIINDLNKMYEETLQNTFKQYGGVRNIDYDVAADIAYNKFKKQSLSLKSDLKSLSSSQDKEFKNIVSEKKKKAPKGTVLMMTSDGVFGYVPENEVKEAMKDGLVVQ